MVGKIELKESTDSHTLCLTKGYACLTIASCLTLSVITKRNNTECSSLRFGFGVSTFTNIRVVQLVTESKLHTTSSKA